MQRIHWVAPLALVFGLLMGAAAQDAPRYVDTTYGFSLTPPGFSKAAADAPKRPVTPVMFGAAPEDGFGANINVQVQPATPLEKFKQITQQQFTQMKWKTLSVKDLKVGELAAIDWIYEGTLRFQKLRFRSRAIFSPKGVYMITCTSLTQNHEKYAEPFERAVSSFRVD